MVDVSCHHRNDNYYDWSSRLSQEKSASGLAIVQSGTQTRRLFIDGDGYIAQELNSITVRVGPKAAKGSQLATAVAAQSDIIHLFYIALDKSLSSITFNGTAWDTSKSESSAVSRVDLCTSANRNSTARHTEFQR